MSRIGRWVIGIVLSVAVVGCGSAKNVTVDSGLSQTFSDGTIARVVRATESDKGVAVRGEVISAKGQVLKEGSLGGESRLLDGVLPLPDGRFVVFGLVQGDLAKGGVVYSAGQRLTLQFKDGLFLSPALSLPANLEIQVGDSTLKSTLPEAH